MREGSYELIVRRDGVNQSVSQLLIEKEGNEGGQKEGESVVNTVDEGKLRVLREIDQNIKGVQE